MNRRTTIPLLAAVLVATLASAGGAATPANPRSRTRARALLDFFHDLTARTEGRRIVSGQFTNFGDGASLRILEQVHELTGKWPAMIGVDYADFSRGSLTFKKPNEASIAYWKQGGLVTVSAHLYNPANPKGGGFRDTGVNLDDLLRPDTDTHRRWMAELDLLAAGLQELREAGVAAVPRDERRLVLVGRQRTRQVHPGVAAHV
jgi:mannan endo-1,4-beta-mannosidase